LRSGEETPLFRAEHWLFCGKKLSAKQQLFDVIRADGFVNCIENIDLNNNIIDFNNRLRTANVQTSLSDGFLSE
jgi:hypothetical protein